MKKENDKVDLGKDDAYVAGCGGVKKDDASRVKKEEESFEIGGSRLEYRGR